MGLGSYTGTGSFSDCWDSLMETAVGLYRISPGHTFSLACLTHFLTGAGHQGPPKLVGGSVHLVPKPPFADSPPLGDLCSALCLQ